MGKIPSPPASNANKNGAKSGNAAFGPRDLKKAVGNNNASKGGLLASNKTDSVSPGPGKQVMGGPQGKTPYANIPPGLASKQP